MSKLSQRPVPYAGERPTVYADHVGRWYAASASDQHKKRFGQYLTPVEVADFMAGFCVPTAPTIHVLDPGAGAGVLSCALCEALAASPDTCAKIVLEAHEIDRELAGHLVHCLSYAAEWLQSKGVTLDFRVRTDDFILAHSEVLDQTPRLFSTCSSTEQSFDIAIANPPYFKVPKSDPRAQATASIVYGQPNIYAMFMAICAFLLKPGGQLIVITPRSYAAGPYFCLFRERFFAVMKPLGIHLFGSRRQAFNRDEVLQENVILLAQRDDDWSLRPNDDTMVTVSSSMGVRDLFKPDRRVIPIARVLDMHSKHRVLRIPITQSDDNSTRIVHSWTGSLHTYGLEVSTGPVVAFRATEFIVARGDVPATHAPLLWIHNVRPMQVKWPIAEQNKEQFIVISAASLPLLVANSNYVLVRRFSAKEEHHRLIAAPLLSQNMMSPLIGLENHLNYIYRPHGSLSDQETYGLAAILNSALLDTYFRTSNGNTQVSATELRAMPLPPLDTIREIGQHIMLLDHLDGHLDEIVENMLLVKPNATM